MIGLARLETLVLVAGFVGLVGFVATFDWRVAGILASLGLMASTLDIRRR